MGHGGRGCCPSVLNRESSKQTRIPWQLFPLDRMILNFLQFVRGFVGGPGGSRVGKSRAPAGVRLSVEASAPLPPPQAQGSALGLENIFFVLLCASP